MIDGVTVLKQFLKKLIFIRSGFEMDIVLNELEQERIISKGDNFFIAENKLKLGESLVFRTPAYEVLGFGSVSSCLELETKVKGNNVKVYLVYFERCVE